MGWEIHIFIQKKSGIYHGMEDFIMYKFTDDYLIGIDEIDNEHRRLFQMINEAIDLSKESSDISVISKNLVSGLKITLQHISPMRKLTWSIFMILSFRSKKKNMKHLQKNQHFCSGYFFPGSSKAIPKRPAGLSGSLVIPAYLKQ